LLDWRDRLVDEGIHLASACQLAGFRHVVRTLYEVSDKYCVDVAKFFYETLQDEGMTVVAVCRGLHRATRALRNGDNEMRRVSGESDTARKTDIHHYTMETVMVDDSSTGTMSEDGIQSDAANDNSFRHRKLEDDAPVTAMLVDGRSTCEERDAILLGDTTQETTREAAALGSVYPFRYLVYSLLLHPNAGMHWFVDASNF
jgi:hypothetical protein